MKHSKIRKMEYSVQNVRRQDRLLDQQRALEILEQGEYGVLSLLSVDGKETYGIPLSYVWDQDSSLYIHCAPSGRKLDCLDAFPTVSFCVVGRTHVVSEKFTTGYESIVMRCRACRHLPEEERRKALSIFLHKYCPAHEAIGLQYVEKSFHRTEILRLEILEMSGKCKNVF